MVLPALLTAPQMDLLTMLVVPSSRRDLTGELDVALEGNFSE